jgi:hypothetical protein
MSSILSSLGSAQIDTSRSAGRKTLARIVSEIESVPEYADFLSADRDWPFLSRAEQAAAGPKRQEMAWSVYKLLNETVGKAIASFVKKKKATASAYKRRIITAIIHDLKAIKLATSARLMVKVA